MDTISVLMSVYDSEKPEYLDRAIKSIWDDQTLKPSQVILVKDGALNSGLEKVIENWKSVMNSSLVILKNDVNLGLTKSLNKGIAVAKGIFLARMDSDDISLPSRFKQQVDYLKAHPEIDVIGGSLQEFNSEEGDLRVRVYPKSDDEVIRYICKASPLAHPTVMMRRSIFDSGLKYDEKYRTSQDIALWFDVLAHGFHISNLDEVVLRFRCEKDAYKRRSRNKARNEFIIYCKGIRKIFGVFTWRYAYPVARLIFRLMPVGFVKVVYGSSIRSLFLHKKPK